MQRMRGMAIIHRGVCKDDKPGSATEKVRLDQFSVANVADLMSVLGLDTRSVGLIILNGRTVFEPESTKIKADDTIEFYPLLMGG
jgi:hypothetical protein